MVSGDPPPVYSWFVLILLNCLSGVFSGLNLGLMSLTEGDLTLILEGSTDKSEIRNAKRILPVRKRGNLLLCTLLIGNTLVNVMLSVLTDPIWRFLFGFDAIGDIFSLVLPTCLIVVCGEIIPQSLCSRHALAVGAASLPFVYFFIVVCFPVAWPISLVLDKLLGDEPPAEFSKKRLITLMRLNAANPESQITDDDLKIVSGALGFGSRFVTDVMTPLDDVFALPDNAVLDQPTIVQMLKHGHSRIPVYRGSRDNIVALLFCKDTLGFDHEHKLRLHDVLTAFKAENRVHRIPRNMTVRASLEICKKACIHMLIVVDVVTTMEKAALNAAPVLGIVTFEDMLEEMIQDDIADEKDAYLDKGRTKRNSRVYDMTMLHQNTLPNAMPDTPTNDSI